MDEVFQGIVEILGRIIWQLPLNLNGKIELMGEAGKILAKTHNELEKLLKPGMTTWDIDHLGEGDHP